MAAAEEVYFAEEESAEEEEHDAKDQTQEEDAESKANREMHSMFEELKIKYSPVTICASANTARKNTEFCDILIEVDGIEYPAHKMVLANFSPFFKAIFRRGFLESSQASVSLTDVDGSIMECLLDYIYCGEICLDKENVQGLFRAAHFLQAAPLFELCCCYLEYNIKAENCLSIWQLGRLYSCSSLEKTAFRYSLDNFAKVCEEDEFLELSEELLIELISNDALMAEREEFEAEQNVFDAVITWLSFKENERLETFAKVLREVRLARMDEHYLNDRFMGDARLWKSPACMRLLQEANRYALYSRIREKRSMELRSSIARWRYNSFEMEAAVITFRLSEDENAVVFLTEDGRFVKEDPLFAEKFLGGSTIVVRNFVIHFDTELNAWEMYNWAKNKECPFDALDENRLNIAWVHLDSSFYAIGGFSDRAVDEVICWNKYNDDWSTLSPLPDAVSNAAAVALGGWIYVIGGYNQRLTPFDGMQIYNPRQDLWLSSTLPFPALYEPAACALNTRIYVCSKTKKTVNVFDAYTVRWQRCCDLNYDFVDGPIVLNGRIWALTERQDGQRFLERYSPDADAWELFATFPGMSPIHLKGPLLYKERKSMKVVEQHEGIKMILL